MIQGGTLRIAVIGLGSMGHGMAMSLQRMADVAGDDPDPDAARRFTEAGGTVTASAAEAARDADVLVVAVVKAMSGLRRSPSGSCW